MRVSNESLLHFGHPGVIIQILSSFGISFYTSMDFASGFIDVGLLLPPLPPLLLSDEDGATLSRRQRFPEARFNLRFDIDRIL